MFLICRHMLELKRYTQNLADQWNSFVSQSKNGVFWFNRNYMDYHSDRFHDNSLLIYRNNKLLTVLPANRTEDVLYSHQGLTHGGFIMSSNVTATDMINAFDMINEYLRKDGFTKVIYKPMPSIYHQISAEEDLYALFRNNAQLIGRNISSTIYQDNKIKFYRLRKHGVRKAFKNGIIVCESDEYVAFWKILSDNLMNRHGVKPVHTLEEITLLHSRFPDNIKLFIAYRNEIPLGGVLVYVTQKVIHPQYCSANSIGKELGALDFLFDFLINTKYIDVPIFDFGQSTEQMGQYLNEGLIFQKEGFGGRGLVYDIYEYKI